MSFSKKLGRADIHIHTTASDGLSEVEEVMGQIAHIGTLDVVAITDHNTVANAYKAREYAQEAGVEVIIGSEVSSSAGHILALWITEDIEPGMSPEKTIEAIHAQNGLAIIAHPYANKAFGKFGLESVGDDLDDISPDGIEVYNSTPYMFYANKLAAKMHIQRGDVAAVGGSDAHLKEAIGKGITLFPGNTAVDLREAIINKTTTAERGFGSLSLGFSYAFKYPQIMRQQSKNLTLCKPESKKSSREIK